MKQALDTRTKLLTKNPWPLMIELSIPAVLGMVVVGLYNMMDSIFVGQMVGDVQMGAISVSYPLTLINAGSAAMLGVGSASVLSRAIGKKDENTIKKIMGNLVAMVLLLSVIYTVVGMVFTRQLLSLTGASDNILNYAEKYLRIVFAGSLFVNFFQSANMVIRGEGQLKRAMTIIASGAILNIILDPIFIFACDWGIAGAAWATVIGQIFSFILALRYLWRFQTIHFEKESFLLDIKESLKICSMGISSSSNQIAVTVIQIIQYNSLTYYGALTKYGTDIPLAACGIVMKTNAIILAIVVGISQGTQPIIGFNYGAGQYHRVREAYMLAVKWNLVVSTIAFIAFQFFPQSIISLFGDGDELYFEFAVLFMRTYLFMVLVNGVQLLSSSFFTAIGKSLRGALLALTRQTFFLIPLTLLLPLRFGIMGVLLAGPIADFSAFVLSIVLVGTELRKQKNATHISPQ